MPERTFERIRRVSVTNLDAILGHEFKVLDDGFVRVIDYMGSDESVVQAARVSYGTGTKKVHEDRGLIRYLMRHRHTTPLEMCELKLHVRVPMDHWRQWIRHRTANVNEYSTRYSESIDSVAKTDPRKWRLQAKGNRQGSDGYLEIDTGALLTASEHEYHEAGRKLYENRLEKGVAREQARKDLPLSTYTEAYWKIDLHNLIHFLSLRMDSHAQEEIRAYAVVMGENILQTWCPMAWEAFLDYRLNSMSLSRLDIEVMKETLRDRSLGRDLATQFGWLTEGEPSKKNRERQEFEAKMARLGIEPAWSVR
jgi:thymidylate synthase (FAD)